MLPDVPSSRSDQNAGDNSTQFGSVSRDVHIEHQKNPINQGNNNKAFYAPLGSYEEDNSTKNTNTTKNTNIRIPLWRFFLFLALSGGVGLGGGTLLVDQQRKSEAKASEQKAEVLGKRVKELERENNHATETQQQVQEQIISLKQQVADLQQVLKERQAQIDKLKTSIQRKNTEIENKDAEIQSLRSQIENFKEKLAKITTPNPSEPLATASVISSQLKCSGSFVTKEKLARMNSGDSVDKVSQIIGTPPHERVSTFGPFEIYRWKKDCNTPFDLKFVNRGLQGVPAWQD